MADSDSELACSHAEMTLSEGTRLGQYEIRSHMSSNSREWQCPGSGVQFCNSHTLPMAVRPALQFMRPSLTENCRFAGLTPVRANAIGVFRHLCRVISQSRHSAQAVMAIAERVGPKQFS